MCIFGGLLSTKMRSKQFLIEFPKLRQGKNLFEFTIDRTFLSEFPYSPVQDAQIKIDLELVKGENLLELNFSLTGTAVQACDECLVNIPLQLSSQFHLIIKFSSETKDGDDEIVYLSRFEHEYDLKQFLYESFLVAIPARKTCEAMEGEKPCDQEVLRRLNAEPETTTDEESGTDPRWEKLKDLLNKN